MASPEFPTKTKSRTTSSVNQVVWFFAGALVAFLLTWIHWSYTTPSARPLPTYTTYKARPGPKTFYDDPTLAYPMGTPVRNWDEKRRQWLAKNPSFSGPGPARVVMVTGSQPSPCESPIGDHLLLRLFKNKVDYCRIHGCDVFYNNVLLDPKMYGYWAKSPVIRAAMLAHPEAEWIWWVDADAAITDMDFTLPLDKYKAYNLVLDGWPYLVFEKKSWVGLNAGVFLIRNCQWSMDFLDRWATFGPSSPDFHKWGPILKSIFTDKLFPESDDQSALAYLIVKEDKKWGNKIHLENAYCLSCYWVGIIDKLEKIRDNYNKLEKKVRMLRTRHAEKVGESYRAKWEKFLAKYKYDSRKLRRPFVTHFTGCQPCSGNCNPMYSAKDCWEGISKALNFADSQVLRNFGYFHPDLHNSSLVQPFSF